MECFHHPIKFPFVLCHSIFSAPVAATTLMSITAKLLLFAFQLWMNAMMQFIVLWIWLLQLNAFYQFCLLLNVLVNYSFRLLSSIPSGITAAWLDLSIPHLRDSWIVSNLGLWWIVLQWTLLFKTFHSIFLQK